LDLQAGVAFPSIAKHDLQTFRETYGASGFVCRYLHCVFSTDGFDSAAQRAKHESQHERRYRCAYSSCVYFTPGFTSCNLLKKHNEKWHPVIAEGPTLAESIGAPLSAIISVTAPQNSASLSSSVESSKVASSHSSINRTPLQLQPASGAINSTGQIQKHNSGPSTPKPDYSQDGRQRCLSKSA
jgi:hypothetical protein